MKLITKERENFKGGFALIELLVVIAIVAILAAILFPVFVQAKLSAKNTVCLSNMKQIGLACKMYVHDNDDCWFSVSRYDPAPGRTDLTMWIGYDNANAGFYFGYLGRVDLPATSRSQSGAIDHFIKNEDVKKCPNQPITVQNSLAFNAFGRFWSSDFSFFYPGMYDKEYGPSSKNARNEGGYIVYDGINDSEMGDDAQTAICWEHRAWVPLCQSLQTVDWCRVAPPIASHRAHFHFLHRDGANILWGDTHAKRLHFGQFKRPYFSVRKDIYKPSCWE